MDDVMAKGDQNTLAGDSKGARRLISLGWKIYLFALHVSLIVFIVLVFLAVRVEGSRPLRWETDNPQHQTGWDLLSAVNGALDGACVATTRIDGAPFLLAWLDTGGLLTTLQVRLPDTDRVWTFEYSASSECGWQLSFDNGGRAALEGTASYPIVSILDYDADGTPDLKVTKSPERRVFEMIDDAWELKQ